MSGIFVSYDICVFVFVSIFIAGVIGLIISTNIDSTLGKEFLCGIASFTMILLSGFLFAYMSSSEAENFKNGAYSVEYTAEIDGIERGTDGIFIVSYRNENGAEKNLNVDRKMRGVEESDIDKIKQISVDVQIIPSLVHTKRTEYLMSASPELYAKMKSYTEVYP